MNSPLTRAQLLELYYYMRLDRAVEEQLVKLFRQNKVVGGVYSSLGQEATAVGTAYALEPQDWIAPMIRNIGALLVKGFRPRDIFGQHMARYTSPTRGKDGTSHFGDLKEKHVVSPISMLGDLIPVMTGVAMGARYLGQKLVAMTWIGDGGTSTGVFHEGMNLAASQRAPLICVIENNQWAYSTPVKRQVPIANLADRAKAYGCPSFIVDGNDVLAVYQTTRAARELCLAGKGPVIIEAKTHRMKGHAQHDPAEYVPPEMARYWKERDPIARYERYLTEAGVWSEADKAEIEVRIEREIREDLEFTENAPFPPPELAEEGVYHEGPLPNPARWERPIEEVMPPRSSVKAEWKEDPLSGESFASYANQIGPLEELTAAGVSAAASAPSATSAAADPPAKPPKKAAAAKRQAATRRRKAPWRR
jgi:TPP-dependent pyruvate/acetoin dehydrogenase alpha subunit